MAISDIALDIALCRGQYKIFCPAVPFDPPTKSGLYVLLFKDTHAHGE